MVESSLEWIQFMTLSWLVGIVVGLATVGALLRWMVKNETLLAENALQVIRVLSHVVGGVMGSVGLLVLFIILFPKGSNWIVNTYLAWTSVWQTQFQMWFTGSMGDDRAASAAGLIIKSFQFGSVALGFVLGQITARFFSWVLGEAFHRDACEHERHKQTTLPDNEPLLPQARRVVSVQPSKKRA